MWTLGGVRIFTQEESQNQKQIMPRLQPLAGGTVIQIFGYESPIKALSCKVVGEVDRVAIENMTKDGALHTLVSYEGTVGDFYVSSVSWTRDRTISQTLRPDLDCEDPVYTVQIELQLED
jgi:hypothetical protein